MYLYICNSCSDDDMVKRVLKDYCLRKKLTLTDKQIDSFIVLRDEKGKPYFPGLDVFFSVSHSGNWWACLMAQDPVGLDIEIPGKSRNFIKIAERFFTEEECEYVKRNGTDRFIDMWVRKEAFVKYLGTGISEGLSSFSVLKNGEFLSCIDKTDQYGCSNKKGFMYAIDFNKSKETSQNSDRNIIDGNITGAYCIGKEKEIKEIIRLK